MGSSVWMVKRIVHPLSSLLGSLIATMRSAIATSLGVIGASFLYQNGVEWGLSLNVGILQSMVKYGIWLTPLIYIAYEVRKVVKLNKEEEVVVDKPLDKDEKKGGDSTISGLIKVFAMVRPYILHSRAMQLSLLGCLATMVITRFTRMYALLMEKNIVIALTEEKYFCWELLLTQLSLRYVEILLRELSRNSYDKFSNKISRDLRLRLFAKLHAFSLRWHLEHKSGEIINIIYSGASSLKDILRFLTTSMIPLAIDLIIAIMFLATTFSFWNSILVSLTMVLYLSMYVWAKHCTQIKRTKRKKESKVQRFNMLDSLQNYASVKCFGAEQHEIEQYAKSSENERDYYNEHFLEYLIYTLDEFASQYIVLAAEVYCAYLIVDSESHLTIGDYYLVGSYFYQLIGPFKNMINQWFYQQEMLTDFKEMAKILDQEPEVRDKPGALPFNFTAGQIEFKNVSFAYTSSRPILQNISFKVNAGETVAFVGPTGSGKSSIINLLLRFYDVQEGDVLIDSQNVKNVKQSSLRSNIGVVPQDTVLFHNTIKHNIKYGKQDATDEEVEAAAADAGLHDKIKSWPDGYDTIVGECGLILSGGEKQRVAIARALLKSSPILLMDEATSALDTCTEKAVYDAINSGCKSRTTVTVAHRLSTVINADKIIFLKDGAIIESGTHIELISLNGEYANMWKQQTVAKEKTRREA